MLLKSRGDGSIFFRMVIRFFFVTLTFLIKIDKFNLWLFLVLKFWSWFWILGGKWQLNFFRGFQPYILVQALEYLQYFRMQKTLIKLLGRGLGLPTLGDVGKLIFITTHAYRYLILLFYFFQNSYFVLSQRGFTFFSFPWLMLLSSWQ